MCRAYAEPERLPNAINTADHWDWEPYVDPDESFLIFASRGRPDGFGDNDLYISCNRDTGWTEAENLGPLINSPENEADLHVSPDMRYLFFTSYRGFFSTPLDRRLTHAELARVLTSAGNHRGDIYYIELSALGISLE